VMSMLEDMTARKITAPACEASEQTGDGAGVVSGPAVWGRYFDLEKLGAWEVQQQARTRQTAGLSAIERLRGRVALRRAAQLVRHESVGGISAQLAQQKARVTIRALRQRPDSLMQSAMSGWREFATRRRHQVRTTLALPISVSCRLCSPTVLGSQRSVLAPLLRAQVESFARMIFSGWYQVAKLQAEQARQDEAAALQQRTEALAAELAASVSSAAQSAQQQAEHAQQEELRSAQREAQHEAEMSEAAQVFTERQDQFKAELDDAHRQMEVLADELQGARSNGGSPRSDDGSIDPVLAAGGSFPALLAQLNRSPPPWRMRVTSKVAVTETLETLGADLDPWVYEYAPGETVEVLELQKTHNGTHRGRTVHGWVSLLSLLGTVRVTPDAGGGAVWHHVEGGEEHEYSPPSQLSPSNSGVMLMESSDESGSDRETERAGEAQPLLGLPPATAPPLPQSGPFGAQGLSSLSPRAMGQRASGLAKEFFHN